MTSRYAIYYAPDQGSDLWKRASAWLGRDAYVGTKVDRPAFPGIEALDLDDLTADPRGYGFHATLKAPFELADTVTEDELLAFATEFAHNRAQFTAGLLPGRVGLFHALRLAERSTDMSALHEACVREFDRFRAPMSDYDLARRRRTRLTDDQDQKLIGWGYPYIFDEFRFHMTLTGAIRDEEVSARIGSVLSDYFHEDAGRHLFDGVTIFRQLDRNSPFNIIARPKFGRA